MTSLMVQQLRPAELPIHEIPDGAYYYAYTPGGWEPREFWRTKKGRRAIIPLEIDLKAIEFRELIEKERPNFEGHSLACAVRCAYELEGDHYICAGLAYTPGVWNGSVPIQDDEDIAEILTHSAFGYSGVRVEEIPAAFRAYLAREMARRTEENRALCRSKGLLTTFLTAQQRAEFEASETFHVVGADGRLYRISNKFGHNVHLIDQDKPTVEYCIVSQDFVPLYDLMLAQKLLLEGAQDEFFKTANFRELKESA